MGDPRLAVITLMKLFKLYYDKPALSITSFVKSFVKRYFAVFSGQKGASVNTYYVIAI